MRLGLILLAVVLSAAFYVLVPRRNTIFTVFGQATMYVYLLHSFVLYPIRESGMLEGRPLVGGLAAHHGVRVDRDLDRAVEPAGAAHLPAADRAEARLAVHPPRRAQARTQRASARATPRRAPGRGPIRRGRAQRLTPLREPYSPAGGAS